MPNNRIVPDDALVAPELRVFAGGEVVPAAGNRPFLLDDDDAWYVRDGEVDVFATAVADGEAVGRRVHLFRVARGGVVLSLGAARQVGAPPGRALLAVGTRGTTLLRVPQSALRALASDADGRATAFALIDAWVEALCTGLVGGGRDVAPPRCAELDASTEAEVSLAAETTARPRRNVAWVRHVEGHSHLLGRSELKVNGVGYVPVSRRAWFEVKTPSRVHTLDTNALPDATTMWTGLAQLHALVLRYTAAVAEQAESAARTRVERRLQLAQSALSNACTRLADAMTAPTTTGPRLRMRDEAAAEHDVTTRRDALFAACRLVGETLDVAIKRYPMAEGAAEPRDPVAAIARASRLRTRRVALREDWWSHESGPLLGTVAEGERPVALLPSKRGYVLHDPMERRVVPVTAAIAETLAPFADSFYRPFPDAALGIRDVVRFGLHGCRKDLLTILLMGVAAAILGLVPPIATGELFNSVIPSAARAQLVHLTVVLVACASATALFQIARTAALLRVEARMSQTIQSAVWDRLLSLPVPFFRPYAAGDLAVRAMSVDGMRQVLAGTAITAVLGGAFSLVNFGLMFWYSSAMAWRATLLLLAAVAVTALGSWLQLAHTRRTSELQARTSGLVLQLLTSIAKLRVAGAEPQAFALWAQRFGEQRRLQYRVGAIGSSIAAFNAAFPIVATGVLFWTVHPLLQEGTEVRTGDFLAFLSAYGSCQGALLGACTALLGMLNVIPLYEQAKPILTTRPEVDVGKREPGMLTGDVEIKHATFRYTPDGPLALNDVSIQARPGEFVALVGPSGSGKSTILRLLLGFESLESGGIYYDGQEIGGLDVLAMRRQLGVVLQSGRLMSGDVFTNIAGSAPISVADAWEAAKMAGFDRDVKMMPMGMHTVIGEGGGTLSGGQRQRLLIARAIVHRPRLLFFDEATSALDNHTQAIVSASLERLNATRIVVAHRLSTIINADRIYVIERGRVVQAGRYEQLMTEPGIFADLARRQIV